MTAQHAREPSNVDHGSVTASSSRATRWGLAAKLFAILTLLGAVAVLVTGVLGYMRARDALQESIYNQLTAARKSKARQIETYFRTIRNELSQLATAKMTIDAARAFRAGFDELEQSDVPFDLRRKVGDWYEADFLPEMQPRPGQGAEHQRLPAGRARRLLSPVPLHRRQSVSEGPAQAGGRSRRRQRLQRAARHLPSAAARRRHRLRLLRPVMLADPKSGRLVYTVDKEVDFATSLRTGPYRHSNVCRRRCPLRRHAPTGRRCASRTSPPTRPRAAPPPPSWRRR